jgi:hypothetical protein
MKIEYKDYFYKHSNKRVFTAFLRVGGRAYKVKQNGWFYGSQIPLDLEAKEDAEWGLTVAQMRSILERNDNILIDHRTTFDGMIDGMRYLEKGYNKLDGEWKERIIKQLKRPKLFSVCYRPTEKVFKLYSCVDDYDIQLPNNVVFE